MTTAERARQRAELYRAGIAEGERLARMAGRSARCRRPSSMTTRHAGERDGCTDDGSTCICECHDPSE